jgi:hypothetical protein
MKRRKTMKKQLHRSERLRGSDKPAPKVTAKSIVDFFRKSPLVGADIDLERQRDEGRDIDCGLQPTFY